MTLSVQTYPITGDFVEEGVAGNNSTNPVLYPLNKHINVAGVVFSPSRIRRDIKDVSPNLPLVWEPEPPICIRFVA